MKTYLEWADFFRDELKKIRPVFFSLHEMFAGFRIETEAADDAVGVFALLREWPPLEGILRSEIVGRLACAEWYCRMMYQLDPEGESVETSFQAFVEQVMIEYYRDEGRESWLFESLHVPVGEGYEENEE